VNELISEYFEYDGKKSQDIGVLLVRTDSGLIGEPFLPNREIITETIPHSPIDFVYELRDRPFSIQITLALDNGLLWTTEKRREVARWLSVGKFAPFYSVDDINKIYFLSLESNSELLTNGVQQGYINVTFKSISPYAYSPFLTTIKDLSTITSPTQFTFENNGDLDLYPQMEIKKIGAGDISIKNLSDGNREFLFTGLNDLETLTIYNLERIIETDIVDTFRYDNFNGNYLKLKAYSVNTLEITGQCELKFNYRYTLKG
jgi:phage-related protein